jgi:hypothetical protein
MVADVTMRIAGTDPFANLVGEDGSDGNKRQGAPVVGFERG